MPVLVRGILSFGLFLSIAVGTNWPQAVRAQENDPADREIAAYQFSSSSAGVSVLGGGGQFLQEPGNPYNVEMREALRTEVEGEYATGETFSISGSVIEDTQRGMFFSIPEIGICGVAIKRGPILACQVPPSAGKRALTDKEERWVRWSADRIARFFESLSDKSAEERSDAALIAGTLPSELVVKFLDELETDLGASSPVLQSARANWAHTQELIGSEWVAGSPELLEAIAARDAAKVAELLSAGANPDAVAETGETALVAAVRAGDEDIVTSLLIHGADPRISSGDDASVDDLAVDSGLSRLLELAGVAFANAAAQELELNELAAKSGALEVEALEARTELESATFRLAEADAQLAKAMATSSDAQMQIATLGAELNTVLAAKLAVEHEKQQVIDDLTAKLGAIEEEKRDLAAEVQKLAATLFVMEDLFNPGSAVAVKFVQSRLNALGYDAGPADGQPGQKTRVAIGAFQREEGRDENGEISVDLIRSLALSAP